MQQTNLPLMFNKCQLFAILALDFFLFDERHFEDSSLNLFFPSPIPLSFSLFTLPSCSLSLIYFYFSVSERSFTHNFSKQIQHSSYNSNCSTDPMIQRIPNLQSAFISTTLLSRQNNLHRPTFRKLMLVSLLLFLFLSYQVAREPFMDVILITCSKSFRRFFFYCFHFHFTCEKIPWRLSSSTLHEQ